MSPRSPRRTLQLSPRSSLKDPNAVYKALGGEVKETHSYQSIESMCMLGFRLLDDHNPREAFVNFDKYVYLVLFAPHTRVKGSQGQHFTIQ